MIFLATIFQALLAVSARFVSSSAAAGRPSWLDHSAPKAQDSKPRSLFQYPGQLMLVVNTASCCGFAGPYEELYFVHDNYIMHRDGARVESNSSLTAPASVTLVAHFERWLTEKP